MVALHVEVERRCPLETVKFEQHVLDVWDRMRFASHAFIELAKICQKSHRAILLSLAG